MIDGRNHNMRLFGIRRDFEAYEVTFTVPDIFTLTAEFLFDDENYDPEDSKNVYLKFGSLADTTLEHYLVMLRLTVDE